MDRTTATRALIGAIVIGVVAQAVLFRVALGINVLLLTAAVLASGYVIARLAGRTDGLDPLDAWLPIAALVLAGMIGLRSDPTLVFLDAATAATLLGASMAALGGASVTRRSALAITVLGTLVLGWMCVGILRVSAAARRPVDAPGWRSRMPARAAPIARGLFIALPVLLVFVVLFASADAIFATFAGNLFDWHVDLGELPIRIALAFVVAWPVAGLLAVGVGAAEIDRRTPAPVPVPQSLGAAAAEPLPTFRGLGVIEAVTILVAVDVLFALFVVLQLAYLFGGLDTMAAGGITYANYARGGFFQLVAVTCLAGGLVVSLHAVVERRSTAFVGSAVGAALLYRRDDRLARHRDRGGDRSPGSRQDALVAARHDDRGRCGAGRCQRHWPTTSGRRRECRAAAESCSRPTRWAPGAGRRLHADARRRRGSGARGRAAGAIG